MKFHDTLNKKIFDLETNDLKPEVAAKLKEIANAFIEYLDINTNAIKDVVLTGSMVSYNYTQYSDIDLHLKVNFDEVHEDCPIVPGYLWEAKAAFNKNHDIYIYGIPVEVYAESIDEDTVHNGLYSLWQGKWIDMPEKIEPTDNDAAVEAKFNEFKAMADNLDDSEAAEGIIDKLYNMRKSGLAEVGEFSTENLAFKKVRDAGILDKLKALKKENVDKQLSLESLNAVNECLNKTLQTITENYKDNIYKLATIAEALYLEKQWYKELGLSGDERAPQIMLFIIQDKKNIDGTKLVDRDTFENYQAADNEYVLDMTRDTGYWETDYVLIPACDLVRRYKGLWERLNDAITEALED